jgi:hypothetical protein
MFGQFWPALIFACAVVAVALIVLRAGPPWAGGPQGVGKPDAHLACHAGSLCRSEQVESASRYKRYQIGDTRHSPDTDAI